MNKHLRSIGFSLTFFALSALSGATLAGGNGQFNSSTKKSVSDDCLDSSSGSDKCLKNGVYYDASGDVDYTNNVKTTTSKVYGAYDDLKGDIGWGHISEDKLKYIQLELSGDEKSYFSHPEDNDANATFKISTKFFRDSTQKSYLFIEDPIVLDTKTPIANTSATGQTLFLFTRKWSQTPTVGYGFEGGVKASVGYEESSDSTESATKLNLSSPPILPIFQSWGIPIPSILSRIPLKLSLTESMFTSPKGSDNRFQTEIGFPIEFNYTVCSSTSNGLTCFDSNSGDTNTGSKKDPLQHIDISLKLDAKYVINPSTNGTPVPWDIGPLFTLKAHF